MQGVLTPNSGGLMPISKYKLRKILVTFLLSILYYPLASEASMEVANLTERKVPHTHVYGVNEFVCEYL